MQPEALSKLVSLAKSLGVPDADQMNVAQLRSAIFRAPATPGQKLFVLDLFTYLGVNRSVEDLTYGQAKQVLDHFVPIANEKALTEAGWEEGDLILWEGSFYKIVAIRGARKFVCMKRVSVTPGSPGTPAQVESLPGSLVKHYPFTLKSLGAHKIDLASWQP